MFGSGFKDNKFVLGACFFGVVASAAYYMLMPQNADAQLPEVNDADGDTEEKSEELKKRFNDEREDDDTVLVTQMVSKMK